MKTLETIKVVLEATSEPMKREIKKAKKEVEECTKSVDSEIKKTNQEVEKVKEPVKKVVEAFKEIGKTSQDVKKVKESTEEVTESVKGMNRSTQEIEKAKSPVKNVTDSIKHMNSVIKEMANQSMVDSGVKKYSESYLKLQNDISGTEKKLESLNNKASQFSNSDKFEISKEFKENEKAISDTEKTLSKLTEQQKKMEQSGKAFTMTEDYRDATAQLEETQKKYDEVMGKINEWNSLGLPPVQSAVDEAKELEMELQYIKGEITDLEETGTDKAPTSNYQSVTADIQKAKDKLSEYQEKKKQMESDGSNMAESEKWQKNQRDIEEATSKLKYYKELEAQQVSSGSHVESATQGFSSGSKIQEAVAGAKVGISSIGPSLSAMKNKIASVIKEIPYIGRAVTESAYLAKKGFSMIQFAASKVGSGILKAGGAAASLIRRFSSGIPIIGRFTSGVNRGSNAFSSGFKTMLKYGLGIRSLFVLVNKLRSAMVDGFNNLVQYSSTTNQSISLLQSQLNQLKNSLATAFEPILNVVTPYLSQLIDYVLGAVNALAQFFAAITGKSTYNVAKRVATDYAASLNSTADSADAANESAQELKRTLLGFDEVNKLDDNSDSGSSGSSGSGGSSGTTGADMFTTESVGNQFTDFANMIKSAWKTADFTEIGEIVGDKLNNALENIPWDKIQETSRKIAKSIATFLNGFIGEVDWGLVGKTYAEGLNTVIEFGYTFVTEFNWKQFGTAIGDAVNGFVENLEWSKAGTTFSEGVKGLLTTFCEAVQTVDWKQLGESVKTAIVSVDWTGIIKGAAEAAGSVAGGAAAFVAGLLGDIPGAIKTYFLEKKDECGGSLVEGIFKGINDAIAGVGDWIKENIFEPFIKGFKNAFGIHSPSTVMKEQAGYLISGLLEGLKEGIQDIIDWFTDLPDKIQKAIGKIDDIIEVGISLGKVGWSSIKDFVGDAVSVAISLGKTGWTTIANFVGDKVEVLVSRTKNWTKSFNDWIDAKADVAMSRVKNWKKSFNDWIDAKADVVMSRVKNWKTSIKEWLGIDKELGIKFKLPKIKVNWSSKTVAGFKITYPSGFKTYATGGFPEEGPFMMNKGEIAGKFSNGKGVVANNQQITDGIAKAVGPAVYNAVVSAMGGNSGGSPQKIVVTLDPNAKGIFEIVKTEAENYTDSHGISPFPV